MKRLLALILAAVVCLPGCGAAQRVSARNESEQSAPEQKQYTATFLTLFDTVTTILGRADSEETFRETTQAVHDELLEYHQLFDIYHIYEGVNNLKTVNDAAGGEPVEVDGRIIRLLLDCKDYYAATDGKVNAAMGSVLQLWHETRSEGRDDPLNARLPEWDALEAAAAHTDFDAVRIDEAASTVQIMDPMVQLDVGAVAKGWAVQQVAEHAPDGLLISVGGNVCATGPKDADGTPWVVGIRDVDGGENYLHTLYVTEGCVVTSGDYQRTYMVNGEMYHHIIDPDTLYPSDYWRSVTVVCADSGVADALSTALFLLPQAEGQALLDRYGAEAVWIAADGSKLYSPGVQELIRT